MDDIRIRSIKNGFIVTDGDDVEYCYSNLEKLFEYIYIKLVQSDNNIINKHANIRIITDKNNLKHVDRILNDNNSLDILLE